MLASIFILILFLPAACLPLALDTFFSSSELGEMGICLEDSEVMNLIPMVLPESLNSENAIPVWEATNNFQPMDSCTYFTVNSS